MAKKLEKAVKRPANARKKGTTLDVELEKPGFEGELAAYVFDSAGQLLDVSRIKDNKVVLSLDKQSLMHSRLFIAPLTKDNLGEQKPSLKSMSRLGAYSPAMRVGGSLIETIQVPDSVIVSWIICTCWVRGRVIKSDSGRPVCGAKVHICEVDKLWRWIIELPRIELLRLRDELLKEFEPPVLRRPPRPEPDPVPFEMLESIRPKDVAMVTPLPVPPTQPAMEMKAVSLPQELRIQLASSSTQIIREALIANLDIIRPYLCLWPYWWIYRCDEVAVVETDGLGYFETAIKYLCKGDKPDLYFWVEYKIGSVLETVYKPPVPCYTYWNYSCGSEVTIEINDQRVPACDDEPDPVGSKVQIISIGRKVSMSELHGAGSSTANEGLTTGGAPFGGKIEPRVWFSRTDLLAKGIQYYRWSYRRLTEGDGTALTTPGPWVQMDRTVVRHYAKLTGSDVTHEPYPLGPWSVGTETNLFEIKPPTLPAGGLEWTVMDEREDLASAHFETYKLGSGDTGCDRALDAAGKYELKLELFRSSGAKVTDWVSEGIDLEMTDVPAPFGTNTVTCVNAPDYNRIKSGGKTEAFRMVLHVDNNCCSAAIDALSGTGLSAPTPCGFYEIAPGATIDLGFTAYHPNDFATFDFSVKQGVTTPVHLASAGGRVGVTPISTNDASHDYTLSGAGHYSESFTASELLGGCTRAAFSEALHVWTMAQDGYGRLTSLDAFTHAGFALTPPES